MTECLKVHKENIKNKEYWLAQDFTLIQPFHCVRCKKPFTEHDEEAVNYQGFGFWYKRGSYSGLCPDCIKWYRTQDQSMKEPNYIVRQHFFERGDIVIQATKSIEVWPDGCERQHEIEYRTYGKQR